MTMYSDTYPKQEEGQQYQNYNHPSSQKSYIATLALCTFLGPFGIHRFYTGYPIIGIVQLLTTGGCGLWFLIDYVMLLANKYYDKDENPLEGYSPVAAVISLCTLILLISIYLNSSGK